MQEEKLNTPDKTTYWVIAIAFIMLLAGLLWSLSGDKQAESSSGESSEQSLLIPEAVPESRADTEEKKYDFAAQLPLYDQGDWTFETVGESLPKLDQSDAEYTRDLLAVASQLQLFLFNKQQIRKTVLSINDMAQGLRPPAKRLREISFPQPFSVTEKEGRLYISTQAYHRYDNLALAINSINKHAAVALYKKYLPLFQIVFAELSYPDNYQLMDSIKAATGKVLQAPVITGKIEVIRPSVRYKFADPKLEKLSALDKQMLRMGPENTRMIQNKLRELIEALIAAERG